MPDLLQKLTGTLKTAAAPHRTLSRVATGTATEVARQLQDGFSGAAPAQPAAPARTAPRNTTSSPGREPASAEPTPDRITLSPEARTPTEDPAPDRHELRVQAARRLLARKGGDLGELPPPLQRALLQELRGRGEAYRRLQRGERQGAEAEHRGQETQEAELRRLDAKVAGVRGAADLVAASNALDAGESAARLPGHAATGNAAALALDGANALLGAFPGPGPRSTGARTADRLARPRPFPARRYGVEAAAASPPSTTPPPSPASGPTPSSTPSSSGTLTFTTSSSPSPRAEVSAEVRRAAPAADLPAVRPRSITDPPGRGMNSPNTFTMELPDGRRVVARYEARDRLVNTHAEALAYDLDRLLPRVSGGTDGVVSRRPGWSA